MALVEKAIPINSIRNAILELTVETGGVWACVTSGVVTASYTVPKKGTLIMKGIDNEQKVANPEQNQPHNSWRTIVKNGKVLHSDQPGISNSENVAGVTFTLSVAQGDVITYNRYIKYTGSGVMDSEGNPPEDALYYNMQASLITCLT